jgi:hypothetical protein
MYSLQCRDNDISYGNVQCRDNDISYGNVQCRDNQVLRPTPKSYPPPTRRGVGALDFIVINKELLIAIKY